VVSKGEGRSIVEEMGNSRCEETTREIELYLEGNYVNRSKTNR
jgi:hypothetical protein